MNQELDDLLKRLSEDSKKRGWFFFNARDMYEVLGMQELATLGRIRIDNQDVRIDNVTGRVKAGEFVGVVIS